MENQYNTLNNKDCNNKNVENDEIYSNLIENEIIIENMNENHENDRNSSRESIISQELESLTSNEIISTNSSSFVSLKSNSSLENATIKIINQNNSFENEFTESKSINKSNDTQFNKNTNNNQSNNISNNNIISNNNNTNNKINTFIQNIIVLINFKAMKNVYIYYKEKFLNGNNTLSQNTKLIFQHTKEYYFIFLNLLKILKGGWISIYHSFMESMRILIQMYNQYAKNYQRTIILSIILCILIYRHWKNIISVDFTQVNSNYFHERGFLGNKNEVRMTNNMHLPITSNEKSLIKSSVSSLLEGESQSQVFESIRRKFEKGRSLFLNGKSSQGQINTRPYQNSLDWFSEAMVSNTKDINGSIYFRSRVKIGSSAFLRRYPNKWLNFLAKVYILIKYRWIEWIRRIEWWFVGGWGIISSIGVLHSMRQQSSHASILRKQIGSNNRENSNKSDFQDSNEATLHRVIDDQLNKDEDVVLKMLDSHFQEKIKSSAWIQKMDSYLHGDPNEQVVLGTSGIIPSMGDNMNTSNNFHLSNYRMRRMR